MKCYDCRHLGIQHRLPPCGGSGLKFIKAADLRKCIWSPSMRREWIEMLNVIDVDKLDESPSMRREWIEI